LVQYLLLGVFFNCKLCVAYDDAPKTTMTTNNWGVP